MAKKKNQEEIEKLKKLMLRSGYWTVSVDALEVFNYHKNTIERYIEQGLTAKEVMSRYPNW